MTTRVLVLLGLLAITIAMQMNGNQAPSTIANQTILFRGLSGAEFKQAENFVSSGAASTNIFYTCGRGNMIIGGRLAFGKGASLGAQFKVPPHYDITVKAQLWKIGQWNFQRMIVVADTYTWETLWGATPVTVNRCGGTQGDQSFNISFTLPHNQPQLSLMFTSTSQLAAIDSSWGVNNVVITFSPCHALCGVCSGPESFDCEMWQPVHWSLFDSLDFGQWNLNNAQRQTPVNCSGVTVWGGDGVFGQQASLDQVVTSLPPHYKLKVQFQFWKVGTWNNEQAILQVDRIPVWTQSFQASEGVKLCSNSQSEPEKILNVNYEAPHTMDAVGLSLSSSIQSNAPFWGVKQMHINVAKCSSNCNSCTGPLGSDCTQCAPFHVKQDNGCVDLTKWDLVQSQFTETVASQFSTDGWTVVGNAALNPIYSCNGLPMLGGHGVFGNRASIHKEWTLGVHINVKASFELWKFGAWNGEEIYVEVDGNRVWSKPFGWTDAGTQNFCNVVPSTIYLQTKQRINITLPHTASLLAVVISSTQKLPSTQTAWGIRDFSLLTESKLSCATLYSECNYLGNSLEVCTEDPDFHTKNFPYPVKSIKVPRGTQIVLFEDTFFKGTRHEFSEDKVCISSFNLVFEQVDSVKENKIYHNKQNVKQI